jgi:Protein of unknown function (DUF3592)
MLELLSSLASILGWLLYGSLGFFLLWCGLRPLTEESWPVVLGNIAKFEPRYEEYGGTAPRLCVYLSYVYQVEGSEFCRTRHATNSETIFRWWSKDKLSQHGFVAFDQLSTKMLQEIAEAYQLQKSVEIRYNPDDPSNSEINQEPIGKVWILVIAGIFIVYNAVEKLLIVL